MVDKTAVIAEALDGKRLFVTGSTGFLGTALVERLLRSVPGVELVLLVRPGRRSTAQRRVEREILKNDAFDRLRNELGRDAFDEMARRRITVVDGDVGRDGLGLTEEGREALATVDETGMPDVRMVLLKGFDEAGFVFYTNFESAKGREILSSTNKIMLDYRGSGNLLYLPLDKVMQSAGAPTPEGQGTQRPPDAPSADPGPRSRDTLRNRDRADR